MGLNLPNHAYVDLSLVGNDDSGSVQCHTDLSTCCTGAQGEHRGDWIPPGSEERLPLQNDTSVDVHEVRGAWRVDLRRRNNADMSYGIYRCDIAIQDNDTSVTESVYVGLYASGGTCTYMYISTVHINP